MNMKIRMIACLILGMLIAFPVEAQQQPPSLGEDCDPVLQKGLVSYLNSLKLGKAADQKNLSIVLVDITDPFSPRMAYVNPNEMMYAASLPKIAILLGAFERISKGQMILDEATLEKLKKMIRNSSNEAATEILNRVGKDYVNELLQSPRYRLYDPEKNGGIWVGKEYDRSPAYDRDPLHNLSHGATALQVARFYYLLETGQLVSPEISQLMKSILGQPAIEHKFVKGLKAPLNISLSKDLKRSIPNPAFTANPEPGSNIIRTVPSSNMMTMIIAISPSPWPKVPMVKNGSAI
jgi:beta-lactamase class A